MTRMDVSSATFTAFLLLALGGCGGGGEAPAPAPTPGKPTVTATTAAPAAATPTTLAGEEDDDESPLLAWADATPEEGKAPLTVQFEADTEGGKAPLKHTWKFGDGTADSNEANPKHTYEKPGKYRADLLVADSAGDSDTDYIEIEVQ